MAKKKKNIRAKSIKTAQKKPKLQISEKSQDILFLIAMVVLLIILLKPMVIDGYSAQGVDVVGSLGAKHQIAQYTKETGKLALWNPYIFAGMPQYHRISPVSFSVDTLLNKLSALLSSVFIYYLFAALGCYVLFRYLKMPPMISFIATLIFILMPHYKSLYTEGHLAKFRALMILPWVVFSFRYYLDKRTILAAAFFALLFGMQIRTQHYQIVFYTALLIFAIGIYPLLKDLTEKRYLHFLKSSVLIILAVFLGIMMSAQPLFLAGEYVPYSKRGKTTINLKEDIKAESAAKSDGVQIDYAVRWSTHPSEMLTWLIPGFYGGMSGEKYTGDAVPQLKNRKIPSYWGHMPFTQSYEYMGVITLMLVCIGIFSFHRNYFIRSLLILAIFFILLSFGRHFISFYSIFYDYLPYFNKFRAPVMSVTVTYFILAVLAAYGLKHLSELPQIKSLLQNKPILTIISLFIGLGIIVIIASQNFSFSHASDSYNPRVLELIKNARQDVLNSDLTRYFALVIITSILVLAYAFRKISFQLLLLCLTGLIMFDLIGIQMRYQKKYTDLERIRAQYFQKTATDQYLVADKDLFRIAPIGNSFSNNRWAYYHQTIGGYSAIKMYTIEELIENCLYAGWNKAMPVNPNVLKILNVKYLISPQQFNWPEKFDLVFSDKEKGQYTYLLKERLPRAYFVGDYRVVQNEYDRLKMINNPEFNPAVTAILQENPQKTISLADSSNTTIKSFSPNNLQFEAFADRQSLLVISELYYPPGWKIFVDGREVDKIYSANHATQAIILSAGNHQVDLRFEPDSFYLYATISQIAAGILYLLILISLVVANKEKIVHYLQKRK